MKTNRFFILLLALSTLLFQSCLKDQEDIFDKSSSLRMQEVLDKTKAALTGNENGWALDYYPDRNLSYGGIAYAIKFNDTKAEVFSQEQTSESGETSLYKLTNDDGPVLSFDSYNSLMHAYATPSSSEYEAKDGDFEFIIMDVQSDIITLKGKRSGNMMYMRRLSQPAEDYVNAIKVTEENMYASKYAFVINGDSIIAKRHNHVFTLTDPATGESKDIPFIATPTGFSFRESASIMNKEVTGFNYSESGYWTDPADNSIALVAVPQPLSELFISKNWFFKASSMSELALKYFTYAKNGSAGEGENVGYMLLGPNDALGYSGAYGFSFISGNYAGSLLINADAIDDKTVFLEFAFRGEGNGVWYYQNAKYNYPIAALTGTKGYTYELTCDNPQNPTWIKMEQLEDSRIYFTVYKEEIANPFEN